MNTRNLTPKTTRPVRPAILVALAVGIAAGGDLGGQPLVAPLPAVTLSARAQSLPAPPAAEATQPDGRQRRDPPRDPPPISQAPGSPERAPRAVSGALPDGVTVFDDAFPGVANLDPGLLLALRQAAVDAAADGVTVYVTSGWRSPEYQEQLLREAVAAYGSEAEAARWVATPQTSAHVSGHAVDVGPAEATAWLSAHGAAYGLCQVYANEPWHFELRPEAAADGCPPMYADPTHDPGMQR